LLAETIEEAVERAADEFKIDNPLENMFVAEAFGIQCKIIKSARRHARGVNYFYIFFLEGIISLGVSEFSSARVRNVTPHRL